MTDRIDPWFREWLIKEKLKHSISARFVVRFHVTLILGGAVATGWAANRLLYLAGVKSMLLRHPAAVLAAYAGFLLGLQIWIRYSGIREYLYYRRAKELLEPEDFKARGLPERTWVPGDLPLIPDAGEGCFIVILILLAALLVYAAGGYLVVYAADMTAELVFELLLAAGLIRGIRRVDLLASVGIPRISLLALTVALGASILFGFYARGSHPDATSVGEVLREIMASKRAR